MLVDFARAFKEAGRVVQRKVVLFCVVSIACDHVDGWSILVECKAEDDSECIVAQHITEGPLMNFITQAVVDMKYGPWRLENWNDVNDVSFFYKKYTYDIEEEIYNSYVVLRPPAVKRNERTKSANKN